jgi:hypothetical protein
MKHSDFKIGTVFYMAAGPTMTEAEFIILAAATENDFRKHTKLNNMKGNWDA